MSRQYLARFNIGIFYPCVEDGEEVCEMCENEHATKFGLCPACWAEGKAEHDYQMERDERCAD